MTIFTEGKHGGEYLVSEANTGAGGVSRSRDAIEIASGEVLEAGAVLGKVTASGLYVEYNPGAADGSEVAAGILFDGVDASAGDMPAVAHVRDCEVNASEIVWFGGASAGQIATGSEELATLGIITR